MNGSKSILVLVLFNLIFTGGYITAQNAGGKYFTTDENVAVKGYDIVAYFTQNEAVRGSQKYEAEYKGVKYWLAKKEHKIEFLKNPEKYLPKYGGWCAFAMAMKNATVPSDPETFKLYNGKLYLFFNDYYEGTPFNTIIPWNSDEEHLKKKADLNWESMNK
jgi:YHS domain-containing protein